MYEENALYEFYQEFKDQLKDYNINISIVVYGPKATYSGAKNGWINTIDMECKIHEHKNHLPEHAYEPPNTHFRGKPTDCGYARITSITISKPKCTKILLLIGGERLRGGKFDPRYNYYDISFHRHGKHGYKSSHKDYRCPDKQTALKKILSLLENTEENERMKIHPYSFCEPPQKYADGAYKQDHCIIEAHSVRIVHLKDNGILTYDLIDPNSTNLWYKIKLLVRHKDYFTSGQLIYNRSVYYPLKGSDSPGQKWEICSKFNSKHFKAGLLNTNDQKILDGLLDHYNDQVKTGGKT